MIQNVPSQCNKVNFIINCFLFFCLGLAVLQRQEERKMVTQLINYFFLTTMFVEQSMSLPRYSYMILIFFIFLVCLFMCKTILVVCFSSSFSFQKKKKKTFLSQLHSLFQDAHFSKDWQQIDGTRKGEEKNFSVICKYRYCRK